MAKQVNRYTAIIAAIFDKYYCSDATEIDFQREDFVTAANGTAPRHHRHRIRRHRPGFAACCFADMGAQVMRIERKAAARRPLSLLNLGPFDVCSRGRRSVGLDLKKPAGRGGAAADRPADALIEGFRPGVMERLGWGRRPAWRATRAGLWPHDRLGAGWPAGPRRRP
jgi:hypothetical protein